jgi:hypothetical protein
MYIEGRADLRVVAGYEVQMERLIGILGDTLAIAEGRAETRRRKNEDAIEVTDAMVAAGVEVLANIEVLEAGFAEIAEAVYAAMERVR